MQRAQQVTTNIIIFIEIQVHLQDTVKYIYIYQIYLQSFGDTTCAVGRQSEAICLMK